MKKIRRYIFETNSSSSHSLAFSKKNRGYSYELPVDEDGVLTIPFGEFGWGPDVLKTPIDKLSYYVTDNYMDGIDADKDWEDVVEELKEKDWVRELIDMIKTNCPYVKEVTFEKSDSYDPFGYVDHQSCGTSHEDDISAEELIFSNDVIIIIDNNNSCHFDDYFPWSWGSEVPAEKDIEELFDEENTND